MKALSVLACAPEAERGRIFGRVLRGLGGGPTGAGAIELSVLEEGVPPEELERHFGPRLVGAPPPRRIGSLGLFFRTTASEAAALTERLYGARVQFSVYLRARLEGNEEATVEARCAGGAEGSIASLMVTFEEPDLWPQTLEEALLPQPGREVLLLEHFASHVAARVDEAMIRAVGGSEAEPLPVEIATLYSGDSGEWMSPFDARAILHRSPENLGNDFARGWLFEHAKLPVSKSIALDRAELARRVESSPEPPPASSRAARGYETAYDGSLSRADVLAVLCLPPADVTAAFEAVAPAGFATPEDVGVRPFLADASDRSPWVVTVRFDRLPYLPRTRRLQSGAFLVSAGPEQVLWPIYRDAFALLTSY